MKVIKLVLGNMVNQETGVVSKKLRGILDNGKDLPISTSIEDVKNYGSKEKVLEDLRLVEGQYGDFLSLPRYQVLDSDFSWETEAPVAAKSAK